MTPITALKGPMFFRNPPVHEALAEALPKASAAEVPKAGHVPMLEVGFRCWGFKALRV